MTIKLLKIARYNGTHYKRFFIVYKKYKYINEIFYCVKNDHKKTDNKKYAYIEYKSGRRVLFHETQILGERGFKKAIRKTLTRSARAHAGESLHAIIQNRIDQDREGK